MYQILRYAHREEILRLGWRLTIVLVSWWTTGQQLGLQVPEYASTDTNKRNEALARLLHKWLHKSSQVAPVSFGEFHISLSFEKISKKHLANFTLVRKDQQKSLATMQDSPQALDRNHCWAYVPLSF